MTPAINFFVSLFGQRAIYFPCFKNVSLLCRCILLYRCLCFRFCSCLPWLSFWCALIETRILSVLCLSVRRCIWNFITLSKLKIKSAKERKKYNAPCCARVSCHSCHYHSFLISNYFCTSLCVRPRRSTLNQRNSSHEILCI